MQVTRAENGMAAAKQKRGEDDEKRKRIVDQSPLRPSSYFEDPFPWYRPWSTC
jgi:hypothetical protein